MAAWINVTSTAHDRDNLSSCYSTVEAGLPWSTQQSRSRRVFKEEYISKSCHPVHPLMLKNSGSGALRHIGSLDGPLNRIRHFITLTLSLVSLDNTMCGGSPEAPHHPVVVPFLADWMFLALKWSRKTLEDGTWRFHVIVSELWYLIFSFIVWGGALGFEKLSRVYSVSLWSLHCALESFVLCLKESLIAINTDETRCPPTLWCHSGVRPLIREEIAKIQYSCLYCIIQ